MSFGQPSSFGVLNNSQSAPNTAFSRSSSIAAPQAPAEVVMGDEVQESDSDVIGYVALAGELKVKVFDGQYPEADLPIPSSQLLCISQKRQLFAAGGPQGVVVARTSTLRAAFKNTSGANGNILPFQPECIIPMSIRLSHIAFTSDGTYLLLGAQLGGIAVYLVDEILSKGNNVQPQSQITTGPLLEMKPIPTVTEAEKVCIVVGSGWSQGGSVGIVDVKTSQVQENLKTGVTTVSWSPKGKQIICGGSGGGLAWIKPDGKEVDVVPGVPNYPNHFVSSIFWIESSVMFVVITPKLQPGKEHDNESIHLVLMREPPPGRKHTFYRVNDMTPPFGMASRPTYHSFLHLKAWAPNMKDCLILSNTCSTDIGTVMRLNNTPFTPTSIMSDGRRATLPLTLDGGDTTPIGFSLDLTATDAERVGNPFPNVEQSATSLPCMWILTNEGVISAYWVVYSDAIKVDNSSAAYPELLAYESQQPPQTPQRTTAPAFGQPAFGQPQNSTFGTPKPAFGQPSTPTSTFGQPSKPLAFAQPAAPAPLFGQTSQPVSGFGQAATGTSAFGQLPQPAPAFGQSSAPQPVFGHSSAPQSTFGQSSTFGQANPPSAFGQPAFGSTSTLGRPGMSAGAFGSTGSAFGGGSTFGAQSGQSGFGQKPANPAFGSTTALGGAAPAFGSPTPLGGAAPAFGSTSALGQTRPAFGQSAFGSTGAATGFGQTSQLGSKLSAFGSTAATGGSGFAKFSGGGGFAALSSNTNAPAFLQQSGSSNPFSSKEPDTFGSLKTSAPAFGPGGGQSGFTLLSAFGSTATPDTSKPSAGPVTGAFGAFGGSLGSALSQPTVSANIKDDEMADSDDEVEQPRGGIRGGNMFSVSSAANNSSTIPAQEPPKALAPAFGQTSQASTETSKPSAFGGGLFGSALNKEQPKGAFSSPSKPPTLAPAFGASESKPSAPVSAFGSTSPEKSSGQVGTGLFGSALQRTTSGAQPVSAFGTNNGSTPSKPISAFGTTPAPSSIKTTSAFGAPAALTTSAFGKSATPTSAFAAGASSPSKPIVSAFGQKSAAVVSSPEKLAAKDEVGTAAGKGLPDEDSDEDTDHSPQEAEAAPLPPDFAPVTKKSEPTIPNDAPLPPDFMSTKSVPAATGALKTPLPESAPRTPALRAVSPTPVEHAKKSTEATSSNVSQSPSKKDSIDISNSAQASASASKPTKAPNPMANRRGSRLGVGAGSTKATLSGRTPSQKAGATTRNPKHVELDESEDDLGNSTRPEPTEKGFLFFPPTGSKKTGQQKEGESVLTLGTPTKSPDNKFTFGPSKVSDSSGEDDDDDASETGSDEATSPVEPASANHSGQSSELEDEDGSWVETGDTGDEGSPVQSPLPAKDVKPSSRRELGDLFSRVAPAPSNKASAGPAKRIPPPTSRAVDMSRLKDKTPAMSPKPSKASDSPASALSPTSAKLQQQEAADRQRLADEQTRLEIEKERVQQETQERRRILVEEQTRLEFIKRQEEDQAREMNDKERRMNERDTLYRKKLESPFEPSPVLKQLIPYREAAPFTNFKGHDAFLEHLVIALERRIDNFGMNMRQLEAFVVYHRDSDHFTLDDPRPVDEIRVTAAPDVNLMATDLIEKAQELEKTFDLVTLKAEVTSLTYEADYLVARASDIPNILLLHTHPELRAHIRRRPLSAQQRMQQASLRRKVPLLRRKIKRAEDAFRILQARVATLNKHQKANYGDIRPPTIEQVRETVARLTDVAKEKAERVDRLEDTLRKMRLSSASPIMSRGTTPSFRAGSVSFSASARDFERGGTPGWSRSTRKAKDSILATPPRNMPGPDKFDYYENTIDSPISRFSYARQTHHKPVKNTTGTFGLIEEELGDDEYFNDQNASSSMGVPIATSYDRGMAELRKEILTTPKKGEASGEIPNTPASRQVNRLLKDEVEEMTGGRAKKAWIDADDYLEDKRLKKEVGKRMTRVMRKIGVKTTKVELA